MTTRWRESQRRPQGCPPRFDQSEIPGCDQQALPQEHPQAKCFDHWVQLRSTALHLYRRQTDVLSYPNTRSSACQSVDQSLRPSLERPTHESGHTRSFAHWATPLQGRLPTPKTGRHRRLAAGAHCRQHQDCRRRADSKESVLHRHQESSDSHCFARG